MSKRLLIVTTIILFLLPTLSAFGRHEGIDKKEKLFIESEVLSELQSAEEIDVIVVLKEPIASTEAFNEFENATFGISGLDLKLKHKYSSFPGFSGKLTRQGLEKLKQNPKIRSIHIDRPFRIALQDSVPLINADDVWGIVINGTNVTGAGQAICIIDTGVDYNHTDLGGCFGSECKVVAGYDFVNNDNDPMDDNGHGTHVAGIVAANGAIKGVAPGAKIVAIKVLDSGGSGLGSDVIAGIDWCKANASIYNITVISMSLASQTLFSNYCDSDPVASAANSAANTGIFVVAASGNDGSATSIASPACGSNVTSVAAATKADVIASFSNTNNITDLLAPGVSINSTSKGGGYTLKSGTSMATPHVSGAGALLRHYQKLYSNTSLTPREIEGLLKRTGIPITDSDNGLTFKRIDVFAAKNEVLFVNESESSAEKPGIGKITFSTQTNMSGASDAFIISNGSIFLDTNTYPAFNKPATIKMFGLNFTRTPAILKDGQACPLTICSIVSYSEGNLTFSVTGWTNYSTTTNSPPSWSGVNATFPPSPANYSENATYQFNISWFDDWFLDAVLFEHNFTGTFANYSPSGFVGNNTNRTYFYNYGPIAAGNYSWRSHANDTSGAMNSTETFEFVVLKSIPSLNITILPNTTVIFGTTTNVSCRGNAEQIAPQLARNGTNVGNPDTAQLAAGSYNYTCSFSGNANFTSATTIEAILTVSKASSEVNLTINSIDGNVSALTGQKLNITAILLTPSSGNIEVFSDGVLIANGSSPQSILKSYGTPGIVNVTARYHETENHTTSFETHFINISLDETPPNITSVNAKPRSVIVGRNVTINMTATDNVEIDKMIALIAWPNSTITAHSLPTQFTPVIIGRHNVTFITNDTTGNNATSSDFFISAEPFNFTLNVTAPNITDFRANITIFYPGSEEALVRENFSNNMTIEHPLGVYDLQISNQNGSIVLRLNGVNLSESTNKSVGLDSLPSPVSGYIVSYGVDSGGINFTNATLKLSYANTTFSLESALRLYVCENWAFASRTCLGSFSLVENPNQNTTGDYFEINRTSFSGFSIAEATESSPPTPSGGGGRGSRRGGGGIITTCVENWSCSEWSECIPNATLGSGIASRKCIDLNRCGTTKNKPTENINCTPCFNNWSCSEWSVCVAANGKGKQTRTCNATENANCLPPKEHKPEEERECTVEKKEIIAEKVIVQEKEVGITNKLFRLLVVVVIVAALAIIYKLLTPKLEEKVKNERKDEKPAVV